MEHWELIRAERLTVADLLEGLGDGEWATPSLCGAWDVKDVAAHLTVGPTASTLEVLRAMAAARGRFTRANELLVRRRRDLGPQDLVALLREHAGSRFSPPTYDWQAPLTDVLVHREDIAVPLGLPQDRPPESWRHALDFLTSAKARPVFTPRRLPDVRLVASDVDWSVGSGDEAVAPAAVLGVTLTGRTALLDRLDGPGAPALAAWARG